MDRCIRLLNKHKKCLLLICTLITAFFTIVGFKQGIFQSQAKMEAFLGSCGIFAPLFFVLLQAVQVVIPILPGAIGCVYGVVFWGPVNGFILNYIGICIGSVWAFLFARCFGQNFVLQMTGNKFFEKYSKYLFKENKFEKIFAILIFLPVAPDDFLCYLAGISKMPLKRFTLIILLGKPFAIFLYSMGLNQIFQNLLAIAMG